MENVLVSICKIPSAAIYELSRGAIIVRDRHRRNVAVAGTAFFKATAGETRGIEETSDGGL